MSADLPGEAGADRAHLATVDSTNAEGFRRAPGLTGPLWILADQQTAGRGRRARPWVSPPGNFHGTLVLQTADPPARTALRSFVAALALREACVALTGLPQAFALKWPNDVLLNGGKLAGILLEASGPTLCIGIGVNLIAAPPVEALDPGAVAPVSLLHETGHRITPDRLLDSLAPACARWEARLRTEGFGPLRAEWLAHAARLGTRITARTGTDSREGIFDTIDDTGALVLRMACGPIAIPAAEVFF